MNIEYGLAEKKRINEENAEKLAETARLKEAEQRTRKESLDIINAKADLVEKEFNTLSGDRSKYIRWEAELEEARTDFELLLKNITRLHPVDETTFTERKTKEAKLWCVAYYALPILDVVFSFFAVLPIAMNLLSGNSLGGNIAIGIILAVSLGYGMTMLTRWGQSWSGTSRLLFLNFVALIVPSLYWISYTLYAGKLGYTIGFSLISLTVQMIIIYGFDKQMWAFAYLKDKKKNDDLWAERDKEVELCRSKIEELENNIKDYRKHGFSVQFYEKFGTSFRELARLRRTHVEEFHEEPSIDLDQKKCYLGNFYFYRVIEIPFLENNCKTDEVKMMDPPCIPPDVLKKIDEDWYFIFYMKKGDFNTTFIKSLNEANNSGSEIQGPSNQLLH